MGCGPADLLFSVPRDPRFEYGDGIAQVFIQGVEIPGLAEFGSVDFKIGRSEFADDQFVPSRGGASDLKSPAKDARFSRGRFHDAPDGEFAAAKTAGAQIDAVQIQGSGHFEKFALVRQLSPESANPAVEDQAALPSQQSSLCGSDGEGALIRMDENAPRFPAAADRSPANAGSGPNENRKVPVEIHAGFPHGAFAVRARGSDRRDLGRRRGGDGNEKNGNAKRENLTFHKRQTRSDARKFAKNVADFPVRVAR